MDTLGIALIVVAVVVATLLAALLHERSQVADARRRAAYARERQIYEARKAILLAKRAAAARGAVPAGAVGLRVQRAATYDVPALDGDVAEDLPGRKHFWSRRPVDESLPPWVFRPLRPGEDPRTAWWVRLRATVGLGVMVAVLGVAAAATAGAFFMAAGLLLERFAS